MDILDGFQWHSSFDTDTEDFENKKIVRKLEASKKTLGKFIRASNDSDFLIHKSTKALWRFSEDGGFIEPVFDEDVLTDDDLN